MSDRVKHCPFLNRADARCSSHFSLGYLSDALGQCFDQYAGCGVYRELLLERRRRRGDLPGRRDAGAAGPDGSNWHQEPSTPHGSPFVPLTLGGAADNRRYATGR